MIFAKGSCVVTKRTNAIFIWFSVIQSSGDWTDAHTKSR
jgi:hypothetical protein